MIDKQNFKSQFDELNWSEVCNILEALIDSYEREYELFELGYNEQKLYGETKEGDSLVPSVLLYCNVELRHIIRDKRIATYKELVNKFGLIKDMIKEIDDEINKEKHCKRVIDDATTLNFKNCIDSLVKLININNRKFSHIGTEEVYLNMKYNLANIMLNTYLWDCNAMLGIIDEQ